MAITCSKFLSQLLVSSFQLLLPVVVSCIVWMFVVRLWFSFWGQWQNCRLIWTFSCGVLLYYCTCANHTPFQIVQWQVGLRKRSGFFRIWRKRCLVVYTFFWFIITYLLYWIQCDSGLQEDANDVHSVWAAHVFDVHAYAK